MTSGSCASRLLRQDGRATQRRAALGRRQLSLLGEAAQPKHEGAWEPLSYAESGPEPSLPPASSCRPPELDAEARALPAGPTPPAPRLAEHVAVAGLQRLPALLGCTPPLGGGSHPSLPRCRAGLVLRLQQDGMAGGRLHAGALITVPPTLPLLKG